MMIPFIIDNRQRQCTEIAAALDGVAGNAAIAHFVSSMDFVVKKLNKLLADLADVPTEGNTREILRQVRNTMMHAGRDQFRDPAKRARAIGVLNRLAVAVDVHPEDVQAAFDELYDAQLDPVGIPIPDEK